MNKAVIITLVLSALAILVVVLVYNKKLKNAKAVVASTNGNGTDDGTGILADAGADINNELGSEA